MSAPLVASATTFLGATDAFFDAIEGSRTFDIAWGAITGGLCFSIAAPLLWWMISERRVSYFGTAIDPGGWLQFAFGLFGMFMTFSNFGCRLIPHHHLDWVHPGFLVITVLYVTSLAPRVVLLASRARERSRARAAGIGAAFALGAASLLVPMPSRASDLPVAVPPPAGGALIATLEKRCGPGGTLVPVHGVVTSRSGQTLVADLAAVPETRPASRLTAPVLSERAPERPLRAGESFDAELATCARRARTAGLLDAHRAPAFVAGVPDQAPVTPLAAGSRLPTLALVDQTGRAVDLAAQDGKILLLSFVFTRCPDREICPAISGKFSYMQHHLDPQKFHLAVVTLDPPYDSPAVMAAYGRQFEADPSRWSLLTGEANDVKHLLEDFGLTSLSDRPGRYVHDDQLAIVRPDGTIDRVIDEAGWNPDDVLAQAQTMAGEGSNPLRRLELASIADVAAFCGGSESVGVVVLDSVVFLLGVGILGGILYWWGRRIFVHEREA